MTSRQPRPPELEKAITTAVSAFHAGNLELAESLCRKMLSEFKDYADAYSTFGHFLMSTQRLDDSIPVFRTALDKDPARYDLHVQLAHACTIAGQFKLAEDVLEKAANRFQDNPEILNAKGNAMAMQARHADAIPYYREASEILPDWPTPRENLCSMFYELRRYQEAEAAARELLEIQDDNAIALNTLGIVLLEREKSTEAIKFLERAMQMRPRDATIIHNVGLAYSNTGNLQQARQMYRNALAIAPHRVDILQQLLHITRVAKDSPEWQLLKTAEAKYELFPEKARYQFHFSYGKAYTDIEEHDEAFEHFAKANAIKHRLSNSNLVDAQDRLGRLQKLQESDFMDRVAAAAMESDKPVFIVGMPRSGSTLVEQIITSHPDAQGGGELSVIPDMMGATEAISAAALVKKLESLSVDDLRSMGVRYLETLDEVSSEARRVCDKQLANFVFLPFLLTLFPNARVVHCLRNPLDTCLSCHFNDFARSHFFTTDLTELGSFYTLYRDMMKHWQTSITDAIHTVQYEKLVTSPESESRALLNFLGLPWDEACLKPHESGKNVRTASVAQVREPIYNSSVGRWRHYQKHLQPLVDALGPYAAEAGAPE